MFGLLSAPPVQGWLLRRLIATQPGWRLDFDRFGAGLTGVELRGADFGMPGVDAQVEPLAIHLAPSRLLTHRELSIERVQAQKLRVTITPAKFAAQPTAAADSAAPATAAAAAPFGGVLALLRSPVPWALDAATIDGEIAVREAGQSLVVGVFTLTGGGLSGSQTGEFPYELALNSVLLPPGPENKVRSHGTLRLAQTPGHGVGRIELAGTLELPHYGRLVLPPARFTLAITAAAAGEDYRAHLDFGAGGTLDFTGHLDAGRSLLTGHLDVHADATLAASLLGENAPHATLALGADLQVDLRSGAATATLAGDFAGGDWGRLRPELAIVDALRGHFDAVLARHAGRLRLEKFAATAHGEKSPIALECALTQPVDLPALPGGSFARLALTHAPLAWANPWLAAADVQLSPAEFSGAWSLARDAAGAWTLATTEPCTTTALSAQGAHVPLIPPARFTFSPKFTLGGGHASVDVARLSVLSDQSDRVVARLVADYELATGAVHSAGRIRGTLPTLLAGGDAAVPFSLVAAWDCTLTGTRLAAQQLEFTARSRGVAEPFLSLQLLQPLAVDLKNLRAVDAAAGDWLRLQFHGLPLGWVSRWLPGRAVTGTLAAGESVLRSAADGRLTLESVVPWRIADASFAVGGRTLLAGELGVTPGFALAADHLTAHLAGLVARDDQGNRVTGAVSLDADLHARHLTATIDVDADLPKLPHSAETFGALRATLHAKTHNEAATIGAMDEFTLRLRNADRELLTVEATQPFIFGLSNSGLVVAATIQPLRLALDAIPLAWLRPWIADWEFEGTLQPCELLLTARQTQYLLRPVKPVQVRGFAARARGRELARDTQLTLFPGADLTFVCIPLPAFNLAYSGHAYLTDVALEVGGRRALDLDAALGFLGDDRQVLPGALTLTSRLDLAPLARLPAAVAAGVPARGTVVARIDGDLLGKEPLEYWARLDGVPSADGTRTLPALELSARGRIADDRQVFRASVELNYATTPRATDARFSSKFALSGGEELEINSSFRSQFIDAGEVLALVEAFLPKAKTLAAKPAAPTAKPDAAARPVYPRQGVPFWSALRGHFNLDLGAVQFAPYRIDHLQGRLDARDRELVLSNLNGEMFAGRFGGQLRVDYDPAAAAGDHALAGEFHITQFDSARVVQTAFPHQLASLDARIDVTSTLASHGNALPELIERAEAAFSVEGSQGVMRLHVPQQDTLATAAVFGGALLLSPELRALGRLLKSLAELPVQRVAISGQRTAEGEVNLREFRLDSPQARLLAHGRIPAVDGAPLMERPLELSVDFAAKDEMAVILGGMSLLETKPRADGYRPLKEAFVIGGTAGQPDTRPFYDLLAKGVVGSKGTWGFLMRKVQNEIQKSPKPAPKTSAALVP